jgi:heme/copper-type cytochrome/quinol oxidase subunit 3
LTATAVADPHAHAHHYTSTGLDNRKIAIWAFIGSECMLFASLISTYLIYKGRSIVGPFPHEVCNPPACATVLKPILNIPVTSQSTFVLLMSSLSMVLALAAVENRDKPRPANAGLGYRILSSS